VVQEPLARERNVDRGVEKPTVMQLLVWVVIQVLKSVYFEKLCGWMFRSPIIMKFWAGEVKKGRDKIEL
jgi:hypothetical protein